MDIFQDLGNRPIIVIRFNPDSYINKNGKKIDSCFQVSDMGNYKVWDLEWNNRIDVLKNLIKKYLIEIPNKEVTMEFLFYTNIMKS